jgi:ketosteroid isomerase-like protein
VNRLVRAINAGDLKTAVELYEPDAVLMVRPGQLARGWAQLYEALAGFVALRAILTSEMQDVLEAGDLALYLGRWTLRGTDPTGKLVTLGGESTDVLRRYEDGRWLIAVDNPWGAQVLAPTKRLAPVRPLAEHLLAGGLNLQEPIYLCYQGSLRERFLQ